MTNGAPVDLDPKLTVGEVLARWPTTASVFVLRCMACVGCTMAPFDTLGEAAVVYGIDERTLLRELESAATATRGSVA